MPPYNCGVREIVIIGAGPAGSAATILLARQNWAVTLIEQHRFPRNKVCGECLSSLGVEVIQRLGLLPSVLESGGIWLHKAILHNRAGASIQVRLPQPMLGLSRHALDSLLLESARSAGATLRQPARCENLCQLEENSSFRPSTQTPRSFKDNPPIQLRVRDCETNQVETLSPSYVMIADGKSALLHGSPKLTGDIGIKAHWREVNGPRDAIELFSGHGCYGGLAPIEGDRWNTAFSVQAKRVLRAPWQSRITVF